MASSTGNVQEAEIERQALEDIDNTLDRMDKLQRLWTRELSRGDLEQAQGRKCVLGIVGLKYHSFQKFFEVTPTGVQIVAPYEGFNSYIEAPLDSVTRVLKGVLDGDSTIFTQEWARGIAKIRGNRKVHDGYVFNQVFARLAEMFARYKQTAA